MNSVRFWLGATLMLVMLCGCGGTNPVDNGGGGGGSVTDQQRALALSETGGYFAALKSTLPRAEAAEQMVQYLKGRSEFEDADTTGDGSVWGRFTDGRLAIFVNNVPEDSGSPVAVAYSPRSPSLGGSGSAQYPSNIPGSRLVWISDPLGSASLHNGVLVSDLVAERGYTPVWRSGVEDLKDVSDVGILFVDGLGGSGRLRSGETAEYAVCTATTVQGGRDTLYASDLNAHRLLYMFAAYDTLPGGGDRNEWHYAFTGQFVQEYMSFSENSLAFVCSGSAASDPGFVNAFLARGASVFAGFTQSITSTYARRAVVTFFDRTTGDNQSDPKEDPPQRAFDWQRVLTWMQSKQYDYGDEAGTSRLVIVPQSGSGNPCGPLAPSIAMMYANPSEEELYLWGIFGDDPGSDGQVTINGSTTLPILDWGYNSAAQMDRITCHLASDGPGSYGDVQVVVRGIKSNVRQLSRYKGHLKLTHDTGDGRKYDITFTLQFRVDLLTYRTEPGSQPIYDTDLVINADIASYADYTCSGTTDGGGGSSLTWSAKGSSLHNNIDGSQNSAGFIAGAWFDPANHKMQVYVQGSIEDGLIEHIVVPTPGVDMSFMQNIIFGFDTFDGEREDGTEYVEVTLNSDFSIPKGSSTAKEIATYFGASGPTDTVKMEWDDIKCDSPPDPTAARAAVRPPHVAKPFTL